MTTDDLHRGDEDNLDPILVQQFRELQEIPAPDTWGRTIGSTNRWSRFVNRRSGFQAAAAVVLLAGSAALIATGPGSDGVNAADDTKPSTTTTTAEEPAQPEDVSNQGIPLQTITYDNVTVADLRLVDGTRFRLSVPERFGAGLDYTEPEGRGLITVKGDGVTIEIRYGHCTNEDNMTLNAQGSAVSQHDGVVEVCRADEVLTMTATVDVELAPAELDGFDLRPVAVSGAYSDALARVWPGLANCGNCAPWGPMVFPEQKVVVNRIGPSMVAAVDLDSLAEVWVTDAGDSDTFLHGGPGGVYLEVTGGPLLKLDPATGRQEWVLERDPDERDLALTDTANGSALLQTSFTIEGSRRAPTLRRIDLDSGAEIWSATGEEGTSWQQSRPVEIDGLFVMATVSDETVATGSGIVGSAAAVWAFDAATGQTMWKTEAASMLYDFEFDLMTVLDTETGPVLIIRTAAGIDRLDTATGDTLWSVHSPRATINGTELSSEGRIGISLSTGTRHLIIDPADGQTLSPLDKTVRGACPVTRPDDTPYVPPAPWPQEPSSNDHAWFGTDDLWTVVDRNGHTPRKSIWWSANFPGGAIEEQPELSVTYQRLDNDDPPTVYPSPGTNALDIDGDAMINGLEPGTTGCWLATATYKGHSLSYIYEIN